VTAPSGPPTNQPEPEARAYLQGFDDAQNITDQLEPIERNPEDVTIFDRSSRRWTVRLTTGWVVLLGGAPPLRHGGEGRRVITALTPDNARALSDALAMAAARLATH
jgi:hypothetical protein